MRPAACEQRAQPLKRRSEGTHRVTATMSRSYDAVHLDLAVATTDDVVVVTGDGALAAAASRQDLTVATTN
jgi:hypothetical protein